MAVVTLHTSVAVGCSLVHGSGSVDTTGCQVCSIGLQQLQAGQETHGGGHMDRATGRGEGGRGDGGEKVGDIDGNAACFMVRMRVYIQQLTMWGREFRYGKVS